MRIVKAPKIQDGFILDCKQYIPKGLYCYDEKGDCPFFRFAGKVSVEGYDEKVCKYYCHYLQVNTIDFDEYVLLIFDSVKECGINTEVDQEDLDLGNPNILLTYQELKKILKES